MDAFERELTSHLPMLVRLGRILSNSLETAEDLAQETMIRALVARDQFTPGTNMKAWLCLILRNKFYSDKRRSWRVVEMDDDWAKAIPGPCNPYYRLELQDVLTALSVIPTEMVNALLLVADGESYDEAAEILGTTTGTVKSRVSRARSQLDLYFGVAA